MTGRFEDERWQWAEEHPLPLDADFDSDEESEDLRHSYPPHWRRRWPVHREAPWDSYIPVLPDIASWNG